MRALLLMVAALLIVACIPHTNAVMNESEAHNSQTVRIIIGFTELEFDYQSPAFLETLTRSLAAEVSFLRPLSGNAALYLCKTKDTQDVLVSRLNRLAEHPAVKYAELDQKRTTQSKAD